MGWFQFDRWKSRQHFEHQPAHASRGVELLSHRNKGHPGTFEHLDYLGEVGQTASETVNLLDYHDVNSAFFNIAHEPTHYGTLHVAAREATIFCQRNPTHAELATCQTAGQRGRQKLHPVS